MKNTIYLDSDFNFLLLENEEEDTGLAQTKIYINIPTSAAANQALEISVAGGAPITESIPSSTKVNFELSQQYWADNGDVEITPKNDDVTGDTITIHFPESFMVSAALNYLFDDEFEIVAQNENFAEGGSGSGSGSGGGSAFDFVETIRNIGFRLLDEPSNVNINYDEAAGEVQIKWTDPADINTLEPVPCEWAGTVVVRKEGSAPLHRWDGDLIVDSTTRDEYASTPLIDSNINIDKTYYYGIFPYHIWLDDADNPIKHYRYTKIVRIGTEESVNYEQITSVIINGVTYPLVSFNDISTLVAYNCTTEELVQSSLDGLPVPNYVSNVGTDFRTLLNPTFITNPDTPKFIKYTDNYPKVFFENHFHQYHPVSGNPYDIFRINTDLSDGAQYPGTSYSSIDITQDNATYYCGVILETVKGIAWIIRLSINRPPVSPHVGDCTIKIIGGYNAVGQDIYRAFR